MISDDGDEIRGLGFAIMHSTHFERKIDDLLFQLSLLQEFTEKQQRWSISRKIKHAKKLLTKLSGDYISELIKELDSCIYYFK